MAVVNVDDLMLTSLEYADFYTLGSQDFMFRLEDLQDWTVNGEQTINNITGARGVPLASIKSAKGVTGSMTNGVLSLGALRADFGGTIANNQTYPLRWTETITASAAVTASLNYTPYGTSTPYLVASVNSCGAITKVFTLKADSTLVAGEYEISGKTLTFYTGEVAKDDKLLVKYDRSVSGAKIVTNPGDKFSDDAVMVAVFIGEDKCCNQYLVQATFPKVSLNGDMSWGAGDDPKTYDLNFTAYASRCGDGENKFYSIAILDEADVEAAEA